MKTRTTNKSKALSERHKSSVFLSSLAIAQSVRLRKANQSPSIQYEASLHYFHGCTEFARKQYRCSAACDRLQPVSADFRKEKIIMAQV
ncbi:hypothetical protein OESDEN_06321 [Oesophagostomum dentatum]|uniref:Uncharacterized protein n=1 Tax=Oesophagostomum dentatum TaxID=61180 RepID=A0A0B1TD56_OESDE|nr:hypothetical protein OESDEN_06321 [Oesophagostomum dentatum]